MVLTTQQNNRTRIRLVHDHEGVIDLVVQSQSANHAHYAQLSAALHVDVKAVGPVALLNGATCVCFLLLCVTCLAPPSFTFVISDAQCVSEITTMC